jgi:hypothetical protein
MWVRNCTHLLAAGSFGVEKIQQDGLVRLPGGLLGLGQIIQPTDTQGHNHILLCKPGLTPFVAKT